jgi:UDP-N-acetylmuramate--alanine ligase
MFNSRYRQIHFVGIGGIGMSGIAEVLLTLGYRVTGSDVKKNDVTRRLARHGAKIFCGHNKSNVEGAHVVVVSSAIDGKNPEVKEAVRQGISVVPRAEMLAELMRLKYAVAVAGTHGKTSTTSMVSTILNTAGLDPTVIIGGRVNSLRTNARLGKGDLLVAEADESDMSFLKLTPTIGIITNINTDHLENYRDFDHLQQSFVDFANKVPFYGSVVCCTDHPVVRKIVPKIERRCITYGLKDADYCCRNVVQEEGRLFFDVVHEGEQLGSIRMDQVGEHHALNALAAIAVARELDVSFPMIKRGLKAYRGVARRFQILNKPKADDPIVVDDYAHHPVEIAATIKAARASWPERRIVVVIQPHRYSRLAAHFNEYVKVLKGADIVVVMEVYSAGEKPHAGITGEKLWRKVRRAYPKKTVAYAASHEQAKEITTSWMGPQDMILFLGAGDITKLAKTVAKDVASSVRPAQKRKRKRKAKRS